MSGDLQIIGEGDGKTYTVNMRGKSFTVILDVENKCYEIKGDIPKEVKKSQEQFIEWFVGKLGMAIEAKNYHKLN